MTKKKIIAVMGATGAQGGGLARAILKAPESGFAVRALVRDVKSDRARSLVQQGAEVVQVDLDVPDSIVRGFDGAYGAFCATFFWAHYSPEKELAHAKTMAEAARTAGIAHVIWSTLEDSRNWISLSDDRMPTLQNKYKVPHFDAKGEADRLFIKAGVPTTYLLTSFFWDNLIHFGMGPNRDQEGRLYLSLPMGDKKLAGIAVEDIGKCALGNFKGDGEFIGKRIGIAGDHLNLVDMCSELSAALGQEVYYNRMTPDVYRGLGFPGSDDLGNMFQMYQEFEGKLLETRSLKTSRRLNPSLKTFREWLSVNKELIPIPEEGKMMTV